MCGNWFWRVWSPFLTKTFFCSDISYRIVLEVVFWFYLEFRDVFGFSFENF